MAWVWEGEGGGAHHITPSLLLQRFQTGSPGSRLRHILWGGSRTNYRLWVNNSDGRKFVEKMSLLGRDLICQQYSRDGTW